MIMRKIWPACEPTALRIPISRVRVVTEYRISPQVPIAASRSASPENPLGGGTSESAARQATHRAGFPRLSSHTAERARPPRGRRPRRWRRFWAGQLLRFAQEGWPGGQDSAPASRTSAGSARVQSLAAHISDGSNYGEPLRGQNPRPA
jgi:hypothetical protein